MAKRKLIEAALPLDAINAACKADKDRKTGTIRNLHKWFAPMPLPAWRALLFATLVDDPEDEAERDRLMRIVERLVLSGGEVPEPSAVADAQAEIARCWPDGVPTIMDPFCGGGSTLVEAQRLGCETIGSDLNPVPVLITRVLTKLAPRLAWKPPLHRAEDSLAVESGPHEGLLSDVLHYARVVRDYAWAQVHEDYPDHADGRPVTAWLWCRTVRCPNPACGAQAPLLDRTVVSKKPGVQRQVVISFDDQKVPDFAVASNLDAHLASTVERSGATCAACGTAISFPYIREQGKAGLLPERLMAMVIDRESGRDFVDPDPEHEAAARSVDASEELTRVPLARIVH